MPFDAAKANAKTAAINEAFAAIGTCPATKMPPSKKNTEPLAWEYHAATHLLRLAEARKKRAVTAAVKAGVMFDHEKLPLVPGTDKLVYAGDVVEISVSVGTPLKRLDTEALFDELEKNGVSRKLLDRLVAKHTAESRAPHKFSSSLITL